MSRDKANQKERNNKVTENDKTALKKDLFIQNYENAYGNVTMACKLSEMSRETYYRWARTDTEFLDRLNAVKPKEKLLDLAEHGLSRKIADLDVTAIIFTLKTLGKERGYIERAEITGKDGTPLQPFSWDKLYQKKEGEE